MAPRWRQRRGRPASRTPGCCAGSDPAVPSEGKGVRLVAEGQPLPLGELIPAALRPKPRAVPRRPGAAERRVRVVVERLVVDVHDAGPQLVGQGAAALAGPGL